VNGKEMRMFAPTCSLQAARSSIVKQQQRVALPEVYAEYALTRVFRNVVSTSTALFTTSVN
jgi:hypothetical protein